LFIFVLFIYFFSSSSSQSKQRPTSIVNENSSRSLTGQQEKINNETRSSMSENENRDYGVLKRDTKRPTSSSYKPLNATEFLAKTQAEIRHEYRKMPNPPAKDTYAAK